LVTPKITLLIQAPCGLVNQQQVRTINIGDDCGFWITPGCVQAAISFHRNGTFATCACTASGYETTSFTGCMSMPKVSRNFDVMM
jgi:hypothetical protein